MATGKQRSELRAFEEHVRAYRESLRQLNAWEREMPKLGTGGKLAAFGRIREQHRNAAIAARGIRTSGRNLLEIQDRLDAGEAADLRNEIRQIEKQLEQR